MNKLIILFISVSCLFALKINAQNLGSISGYVYNSNDSVAIPGANVFIKTGQKTIGTTTNLKGYFKLKPIEPGTYTVIISYVGLDTLSVVGTKVNANNDTYLKKKFMGSKNLRGVEITYDLGLIDEDGGTIHTMDAKTLEALPTKGDIKMVLRYTSSDYFVSEYTQQVYFRGSRAGTSAYYIDGMRVDNMNLPGRGVGSVQVYSGGVPAQYGDFTGGVIVVETKSYNDILQEQAYQKRYLAMTDAPKIITKTKDAKEPAEEETDNPSPEKE